MSPMASSGERESALPCADPQRMGRLLARLEPRLAAVARRLTRDPDAAADVVQSAFEKVLRKCEEFRGGSKPSTWVHRIVVNESLQWLRRERRRQPNRIREGDRELLLPQVLGPSSQLEARQERSRVRRAIDGLPRLDRAVLEASLEHALTYAEIGRRVGLSEGGVKSRVWRARKRLHRVLAEPCSPEADFDPGSGSQAPTRGWGRHTGRGR